MLNHSRSNDLPHAAHSMLLTLLRDSSRQYSNRDVLRLAEYQASQLRHILTVTGDRFPDHVIETIPRIAVEHDPQLPVSGSAYWDGQRWILTLNSTESLARQRWAVLHEIKHIIDHPNRQHLYGSRHDPVASDLAERAADMFASSTLMPVNAMLTHWRSGHRNPDTYANAFGTTTGAARYRLHQIGLTNTYLHHPPDTPYMCVEQTGCAT